MLTNIRKQLMKGDFAENLKMLQTYPPCDIIEIIALAKRIASPEYQPPGTEREEDKKEQV